jgi:hypothetical protein
MLLHLENSAAARQYLDLEKMRAILASLKTAVTPIISRQTSMILLPGLMTGIFLLKINNELTPTTEI